MFEKRIASATIVILFCRLIIIISIMNAACYENYEINRENIIKNHFIGYRLINIEELSPLARDYFMSSYPNKNPFFVQNDIDGNGLEDISLLIKRSSDNRPTIFVILLQTRNNRFAICYLMEISRGPEDLFIRSIEQGEILAQARSLTSFVKDVKLKHPAIELVFFEASAIAYYWNENSKRIEYIWTDD